MRGLAEIVAVHTFAKVFSILGDACNSLFCRLGLNDWELR